MLKLSRLLLLLSASSVILFVSAQERWWEASTAVTLNDGNFEQIVGKDKHVFVDFYAQFCIWCKRMVPEYNKLFDMYHGPNAKRSDVIIAKIDGGENQAIAGRYGVQVYPTLFLFRKGSSEGVRYNIERVADSMHNWIETLLPPEEEIKAPPADSPPVENSVPQNLPKVDEAPKVDEPPKIVETPKPEEIKQDPPKAEEPKKEEAPKAEEPPKQKKAEDPIKEEAPKAEEPPKQEEEPKKAEEPRKEAPKRKKAPKVEEPTKKEEPVKTESAVSQQKDQADEQLRSDISALKSQVAELQKVQDDAKEKDRQNEMLKKEAIELRKQNTEIPKLQQNIREKDGQQEQLRREINDLKVQNSNLQQRLNEAQKAKDNKKSPSEEELQKDIAELKAQISELLMLQESHKGMADSIQASMSTINMASLAKSSNGGLKGTNSGDEKRVPGIGFGALILGFALGGFLGCVIGLVYKKGSNTTTHLKQ